MRACASCGREIDGDFAFCPHCGAALASPAPTREQRKTVTVLFCDVTGSTELGESTDPEALRAVLARYFERMKGIVEAHGGSVEKFIGDAVMAVFGVPAVHEDDALRACRAAVEMRDALPELGVAARIGVNTGEVVTGTEERLATGDAVNVAARLEQTAEPGEVLIGEPTFALVRDAAEVEAVGGLELKGKAEQVAAYRLVRVLEARERGHEAPFVGRSHELALLREAWERARSDRRVELVTMIGDAGIGKSRLVAEFVQGIEAMIVGGRCLPYGEGITYWPVVAVLKQLELLPDDERAASAIRSLLGETDRPTAADEIAWAFRKTLEQAAAERPLVCVFEDIQWGEETFLDLVEHVALLSSGAPILLLCLARPEVVERRPEWPVAFRLEPLDEREVERMLSEGIGGELRYKIARAAGGNPLFVQEMLAMSREAETEVAVPPNLQGLLAARLDQLEASERSVLERGAVEGEVFHRGAVQALAPQETHVSPRLAALVRKELVRPDKSPLPAEDAFRFRHILIRDAAYDSLPKATRADLHERFAFWIEEHGAKLVELDEILGYHLEQACRYRIELRTPVRNELALAARRRLTAAGRRAMLRGDVAAAANLLHRAAALVPENEIDLALELDLIDALHFGGTMSDAARRAGLLADRAAGRGDRIAELCGRVWHALVGLYVDPEGAADRIAALVDEALPIFKTAGDDLALYLAYHALAEIASVRMQMDVRLQALDQALRCARRLGRTYLEARLLPKAGSSRVFGATTITELLAWLDEQEARGLMYPSLRAHRASALAMRGEFDEARSLLADLRTENAGREAKLLLAVACLASVRVELLAANPAGAVEFGVQGSRLFEELGERSWSSTGLGDLAAAYYGLGRFEDAEAATSRAADLGASDDAATQMLWRQVKAKVLACRGATDEAERLAREAVAIGDATDFLNGQADAYADLAEVLLLSGSGEEARRAFEQALERYERKGNLVMAERTRQRLASLRAETRA